MVVPLGCLYSPLGCSAPRLDYPPLYCAKCNAVLNPHCVVEHRTKVWACPFCGNRNSFPPHYAQMSEQCLPMELLKQYDTVEYVESSAPVVPTFALVVDTCVDTQEELVALRGFVLQALSQLPEQCRVCLITYGATVQIHDLSATCDYNRCIVLRGSTESTAASLRTYLRHADYARPFADAEFVITSIIEELTTDSWPTGKECRSLRCTGAALSAAASLLELTSHRVGGAIFLFASGVCTEGPGQVVEISREITIRTHTDIRAAGAKLYDKAVSFYDSLMRRLVVQGHCLNVLVGSLDQVGLAEMKACVQVTGGVILAADSWGRPQLSSSLRRLLQKNDKGGWAVGLNVTVDVVTSPTWKVMGVVGPVIGTGRKSSCVAETEVGMGGTCQWTTCAVDPLTTIAVYFEPSAAPPTTAGSPSSSFGPGPNKPTSSYRYVQMVTRYQSYAGTIIRVTTLRHSAQLVTNFTELANFFDQEAAAVLIARWAVSRTDTQEVFDVLRWIDRSTIRLVSRFGEYTKDQPQSLRLPQRFSLFPCFIYHLRRSAYLQVFNSSPDETAVLRLLLLRAPCTDAITMIHPTLWAYTMTQAPRPVVLDTTSIQPETVVLLDTFFEVLIHHGETIAAWRRAGYEQNPQYADFKSFLEVPRADGGKIVEGRYPTPRFIEVGQGDPDARILYNRINPSKSRTAAETNNYGHGSDELVYTDDAPMQVFIEHLKKLAVSE